MNAPQLQPRKQEAPVLRTLSVLLYGIPKVGKTTEAAKFPGALLLNCEPSGTDLLKGSHEVVDVTGLDHLDAIAGAIVASQYKTIVLDGFTWMINQAAREKVKDLGERNRLRAYALITEQVQRILGDILRGGKIVIATGHSRTVDDDETEGKVEVRPDINPALSNGVFGLFSIIAYCYPTREGSKMLTKPEDNEKRRILAGDRSGVLPKIMRLSADELMAALKATQPQGSANGGAKASAQQSPAKASAAKVEQIKAAAIALYGEEWPARVAKLAEDASGGGASTVEELTPKEAEALMGILESAQADK